MRGRKLGADRADRRPVSRLSGVLLGVGLALVVLLARGRRRFTPGRNRERHVRREGARRLPLAGERHQACGEHQKPDNRTEQSHAPHILDQRQLRQF